MARINLAESLRGGLQKFEKVFNPESLAGPVMAHAGVPKLTFGVISRRVQVRKLCKPVLKASPVKCGLRY